MPLYRGIYAFADQTLAVEDDVLEAFFDQRESYLKVLRDDPDLLEEPYRYAAPWDRTDGVRSYKCPAGIPDDNPLYIALVNAGLLMHGRSALMSDDLWQKLAEASNIEGAINKRTYGEGYALIDVAIYMTYLLNIYLPNRALIQNLLATHSQTDAIGRINLNVVQGAVEKIVKESIGKSDNPFVKMQAADLVVLAKHDAATSIISKLAGRGIDFERQCLGLLEEGGYEVRITPASGDYGADLIAFKDDLGYAVQCKDTGKPVGVKAVQEAVGARSHYKTDYAVVCCSGGFTDAAVELATSNKVMLCNADQLVRRLDTV